MQDYSAEVGWTENQWSTVQRTVEDEAKKARVARRFLPDPEGPLASDVIAVPPLCLSYPYDPNEPHPPNRAIGGGAPAPNAFVTSARLAADADPTLFLTTFSVLVELPRSQLSDPDLRAALTIFRRAANFIARLEDALIINGQPGPNQAPPLGGVGLPAVFRVTGGGLAGAAAPGLLPPPGLGNFGGRLPVPIQPITGINLINAVINATIALEAVGQSGPFNCIFSPELLATSTIPTGALVMPRDRILPHLEGGSIFGSSLVPPLPNPPPPLAEWPMGAVVASNGSPLELVVGSDICVQFLQTTLEPRWVFRVSERLAFRVKETQSIAIIYHP